MPIYEYYSPDTHKIYSFYAKTLAQGRLTPRCPDNPRARMVRLLSTFSVGGPRRSEEPAAPGKAGHGPEGPNDAKLNAAMEAMEREFAHVDENDPRAMARMMRRMAELGGEKLDESMEEVVRKLEEGADPDTLEDQLGDQFGPEGEGGLGEEPAGPPIGEKTEPAEMRPRPRAVRRSAPVRDPQLYDYN
jgi:hypothetical protein